MSHLARGAVRRVRRTLGVQALDGLQARAEECERALAENARLDALLTPRVVELEELVVSVAENQLRPRG